MKKLIKNVTLCVLALLLLFEMVPVLNLNAGAVGKVTIGHDVVLNRLQTKDLDLSETNSKVRLTQADKDELRSKAEQSALQWVKKAFELHTKYTLAFDYIAKKYQDSSKTMADKDEEFRYLIHKNAKLYGYYWWDELDVDALTINEEFDAATEPSEELQEIINKVRSLNSIDEAIAYSSEFDNNESVNQQDFIKGKVEEIYNDYLSDYIVKQLEDKLPVKVDFTLQSITDEEKYAINNQEIFKGVLSSEDQNVGTINFAEEGQYYDEILQEGLDRYINGEVEDASEIILRDNRDFIDRVLFILDGYLKSSDGSQESYAGPRGDANYPGDHCLLEVCDKLYTYSWATLSIPGSYYKSTFNLHLNPAVTYLATDPNIHLLSDLEFNDEGTLTKISKSVILDDDIIYEIAKTNYEKYGEGVYRFILNEKTDTSSLSNYIEPGSITDDNVERFLDIVAYNTNDGLQAEYYFAQTSKADSVNDVIGRNLSITFELYDVIDEHINNKVSQIDYRVEKTWDDENNKDNLRPTLQEFESKIHLMKQVGDKQEEVIVEKTKEDNLLAYKTTYVDDAGKYIIEYHHLPKYDENGQEIKYSIVEDEIAEYTSEMETKENLTIITNTHKPKEDPKDPPKNNTKTNKPPIPKTGV